MLFYVIFGAVLLLAYLYLKNVYSFWEERGVKYAKPFPILGNMASNLFRRKTFVDMMGDIYKKFNSERYFGFYQFMTPTLIITDPELIKEVGISSFNHFQNHQAFATEDDVLWNKNLFARKGEEWKDMRSTLSPSFTGIKMRAMLSLIDDCAKQMVDYFLSKNEDVVTFDVKDTFTRFSNDVIATCAFGVTCNSFKEPENEFYRKGYEATDFSGFKALKFFLSTASPFLAKLFRVKVVDNSTADFFQSIIGQTLKLRQEQGLKRPDMVQLLIEAQKAREKEGNTKTEITVEDMTAQAFIFFAAGFDTTSTLMMYAAYELAVNKDCQDKLVEEINEIRGGGELTYEKLSQMKYMDMVCSEALRLWPPTLLTDRTCTADFVVEPVNPGEKRFCVKKDSLVWMPIYSIHRDPANFENPDKFIPERFSDENKDSIKPGTYLPFGIGPRLCIGNRFALMETKTILFHLLSNFEIVPVKKSVIPVVLSKSHFNLEAENGMWLGLKRRKH